MDWMDWFLKHLDSWLWIVVLVVLIFGVPIYLNVFA